MIKTIEKNKKYKIVVDLGFEGIHRRRKTKIVYGSENDAILIEAKMKKSIENNPCIMKNNHTVATFFDEWLELKKNKIAPKTYKGYELYGKNIKRFLGNIKLDKLTPKKLEDFYNWLRDEKKYATKTIKHHQTLVTTFLNAAVRWDYITSNPNDKTEKVKVIKKEIECYSPTEVQKLIMALQKECIRNRALIYLALDTGCRRGELTGLEWDDIDFNDCSIRINKATQYVSGYGIFEKETKTQSSNRKLSIAPGTLELLKLYRAEQASNKLRLGSKWKNSKKIFTNDVGGLMHPDKPYYIFKSIIKKNNLKDITFHALRHTSISLMISENVQAQVISKKAGHSSLSTTHNTYSHFYEDSFKDAAKKMDAILYAPTQNINLDSQPTIILP